MNEPTKEMLSKFHDGCLNVAKQRMNESGAAPGVAFVWGKKMEVGPWLRKSLMDLESGVRITDEMASVNPGQGIMLGIPCLYGDQALLVHMLKYLSTNPEEGTAIIDHSIAMAKHFGVENPYTTILKVFKQQYGLCEKQIVADFIRKVCQEIDAVAFVKTDEIWMVDNIKKDDNQSMEELKKGLPKELSEHPDRKEAVQSFLETKTYRRVLLAPFTRKSDKPEEPGYKELIWGEQAVMEDTVEHQTFSGRFTNLLMAPPPSATT